MAEQFNLSWINVLDEGIIQCFNKYTPGFMCVGHKPHPFGNKIQTICCGLTPILWRSQIVEGKYRPHQLDKMENNELGKTTSLMLRICRPMFG